jgi:hypothetical protein
MKGFSELSDELQGTMQGFIDQLNELLKGDSELWTEFLS